MKKPERTTIILFLIIIAGAFLRFYHLDLMEFKFDEATYYDNAVSLGQKGLWTWNNLTNSAGLPNPPVFTLLITLPSIFSTNPIFITGFIAFLNVFALWLTFRVFKKHSSVFTAVIITSFFAFNPWMIHFSRKIWNPDLLFPFLILFLHFFLKAIEEKHFPAWIYSTFIAGILVQLHLSCFFLFALLLIYYFRGYGFKNKKGFILAATIIVSCIPTIIMYISIGFSKLTALSTFAGKENNFMLENFLYSFKMLSAGTFDFLTGNEYWSEFLKFSGIPNATLFIILVMFVILLCVGLTTKKRKSGIFIWWIILGLISVVFLGKREPRHHFFLAVLPCLIILAGIGAERIYLHFIKFKKVILPLFLALLIYQGYFYLSFLSFISTKECIDNGDYGQPYSFRLQRVLDVSTNFSADESLKRVKDITSISCDCEYCGEKETEVILKRKFGFY